MERREDMTGDDAYAGAKLDHIAIHRKVTPAEFELGPLVSSKIDAKPGSPISPAMPTKELQSPLPVLDRKKSGRQ